MENAQVQIQRNLNNVVLGFVLMPNFQLIMNVSNIKINVFLMELNVLNF